MPRCPNPECGKEIEEDAVYCPFCGTKLAEVKAQPTAAIKRHVSITACVILLCICFLIHILSIVDFITYGDLTGSIGQLFFGAFALVAAYFLWKSEETGGIIGIIYAILATIGGLSAFLYPEDITFEYTVYDFIIFDVCFNVVLIVLIAIGWKHLK